MDEGSGVRTAKFEPNSARALSAVLGSGVEANSESRNSRKECENGRRGRNP